MVSAWKFLILAGLAASMAMVLVWGHRLPDMARGAQHYASVIAVGRSGWRGHHATPFKSSLACFDRRLRGWSSRGCASLIELGRGFSAPRGRTKLRMTSSRSRFSAAAVEEVEAQRVEHGQSDVADSATMPARLVGPPIRRVSRSSSRSSIVTRRSAVTGDADWW